MKYNEGLKKGKNAFAKHPKIVARISSCDYSENIIRISCEVKSLLQKTRIKVLENLSLTNT